MHILIIPSEEYVPEYAPLAGIFQHDQAKILQQKGHQVGALSLTFKYSFKSLFLSLFGKVNNQTKKLSYSNRVVMLLKKTLLPNFTFLLFEKMDNINIVRFDGFWGLKKSNLPLSMYEMWIKYGEFSLKNYIKKFGKPDVIHAHNMIYAGLSFMELSKKFNITIVITEHSTEYALESQPLEIEEKITDLLNQKINLFAVSPQLIKLLKRKFSNNKNSVIEWLPNVIDTRFEEIVELNQSKNNEKVRFFNLANLIPVKGQKDLIIAFSKAFHNFRNIELVIAGEGVLREELNNLINELKLNEKVKLIGQIHRDEVIKHLDLCDVFVLPSHYETFGVVLIEALSRGVPVISTYCDGPECIVNEKNGVLVQPKNIDDLAQALQKMYHEHTNYNKELLRKDVIELFGKEAFYKRVMKIYKTV
jgi:glycosyltransferase involved in cell wall biosynthesis